MNIIGSLARLLAIAKGCAAVRLPRSLVIGTLACLIPLGLPAATLAKCLPIAGLERGFIKAALPAAGSVRLTYLGHSSFLIETPGGATVVTDYNGFIRPPAAPDIVTMNNAHETHYTTFVEPDIKIVLQGWASEDGVTLHDRTFRDLQVWNVPTNVRSVGGTRINGNSIFVFQAAGLCIAHLGHLHHPLGQAHMEELGLIDVLLVPVDGSYTLSQEDMLKVIEQIGAPVVIPMHYFGDWTLSRFLTLVGSRYGVIVNKTPSITLSQLNLPNRKVVVLPPSQAYQSDFDD
jgi:L-ascorbate metabolism protein UlaG (beta-lactamase superfamily)